VAVLNRKALFFVSADTGRLVYGRIASSRPFLEVVLRYSQASGHTVLIRKTNERTGIYALDGTLLISGQRLPSHGEHSSVQLSLRD
jgi:hypothetical protein